MLADSQPVVQGNGKKENPRFSTFSMSLKSAADKGPDVCPMVRDVLGDLSHHAVFLAFAGWKLKDVRDIAVDKSFV